MSAEVESSLPNVVPRNAVVESTVPLMSWVVDSVETCMLDNFWMVRA